MTRHRCLATLLWAMSSIGCSTDGGDAQQETPAIEVNAHFCGQDPVRDFCGNGQVLWNCCCSATPDDFLPDLPSGCVHVALSGSNWHFCCPP